jgi:2-methyl-3-hydroxypyridine 5-carboxylic acid dioxygenase
MGGIRTRRPHVEIAGAGFAGLTAAIGLAQRGWSVRVHEATPELRAFGAGIFIWENGLRVLKALGAYEDVMRGAHHSNVLESRVNGLTKVRQQFGPAIGTRMVTMTRQHLYAPILRQAQRLEIQILTNSEVIGAEPEGVLFTADGRQYPADLVIGADGVRSRVRDSLAFEVQRDRYEDGIIRLLTPLPQAGFLDPDLDHVIDFWRTGERTLRILYVPCNDRDVYLAMMAPRVDKDAAAIPINKKVWSAAFLELAPIIAGIGSQGRYDGYETTRVDRWSIGRVAIVGDAAHAMAPTIGQGAGCAMMNSLGLAVALAEAPSIEEALILWERRERPLTEHTQAISAHLAKTRKLSEGHHWDDDTLRTARHVPTGTVP